MVNELVWNDIRENEPEECQECIVLVSNKLPFCHHSVTMTAKYVVNCQFIHFSGGPTEAREISSFFIYWIPMPELKSEIKPNHGDRAVPCEPGDRSLTGELFV